MTDVFYHPIDDTSGDEAFERPVENISGDPLIRPRGLATQADDTSTPPVGPDADAAGQPPPLWSFGTRADGGVRPTGDPLKDSIVQALRYNIGLDNPAGAGLDNRAMMRSLGLAPAGGGSRFPAQVSDDDTSPWASSGPTVQGAILSPAGFNPGNVTQSGSWSEPTRPASPGQDGSAWEGARAVQHAYATGGGQTYVVDPKTMGMEGAIDIGPQIRDSINMGGYMRPIYDRAVQTGQAVPFDSSGWGLRRFQNRNILDPDGQTVGRWGGAITGALSATPDGRWSVDGNVQPVKTGEFDYQGDATGSALSKFFGNTEIGGAGWIPDVYNGFKSNHVGTPMPIEFNRIYKFKSSGKINDLTHNTKK